MILTAGKAISWVSATGVAQEGEGQIPPDSSGRYAASRTAWKAVVASPKLATFAEKRV